MAVIRVGLFQPARCVVDSFGTSLAHIPRFVGDDVDVWAFQVQVGQRVWPTARHENFCVLFIPL